MANRIFKSETIMLQGTDEVEGKEVTITPLPISKLRQFMEIFKKAEGIETDMELAEIAFECAVLAIQTRNKDITADELEETLDLPTMFKILEVAGGVNLDPNQQEPVTATKA